MKAPSPKLQLIDTSEPLQCFSGLTMRCGVVIEDGEARWMFANEFKPKLGKEAEEPEYLRGVCRDCIFLEPVGDAKRSMLYGIVEKQAPQSERELEESE